MCLYFHFMTHTRGIPQDLFQSLFRTELGIFAFQNLFMLWAKFISEYRKEYTKEMSQSSSELYLGEASWVEVIYYIS